MYGSDAIFAKDRTRISCLAESDGTTLRDNMLKPKADPNHKHSIPDKYINAAFRLL